jgi:hypothetical protein
MWELVDDVATFSLPSLTGRINVLEPWRGLQSPAWKGTALPASVSVLQVDARELIAANRLPLEVYVRQSDLIATYAPSEGRNVQSQIYWRASQSATVASVELIISAQTHLLDSRPSLLALTSLPGGQVIQLAAGADQFAELSLDDRSRADYLPEQVTPLFLFRPHAATYSYAEMVQPADFAGASLELRGGELLRFSHHLFAERLEKGVIRRVRLRGIFLPRQGDLEQALVSYREFIGSPLPLTT